jgi:hypothetical protein
MHTVEKKRGREGERGRKKGRKEGIANKKLLKNLNFSLLVTHLFLIFLYKGITKTF